MTAILVKRNVTRTIFLFSDYNQRDATVFYYLFLKGSTCFGRFLRPSSGTHNFTLIFRYCQPVLLQVGIVNQPRYQPAAILADNT